LEGGICKSECFWSGIENPANFTIINLNYCKLVLVIKAALKDLRFMKFFITLCFVFISWWGFIGFGFLTIYKMLPDKWYIAIPLLFLSYGWWALFRLIAENYRQKYN